MSDAPAPFVPAEVDLTDYQFIPLDVRRLRDSRLVAKSTGDEFMAWMLLLLASWHQKPAGSLPNDDIELSQLAGYGRVVKEWMKVKEGALYGWVLCADNRFYHEIVAGKAIEGWERKLDHHYKKYKERCRKNNKKRESDGLEKLVIPTFEEWKDSHRSDGISTSSAGKTTENALTGTGTGTGTEFNHSASQEEQHPTVIKGFLGG